MAALAVTLGGMACSAGESAVVTNHDHPITCSGNQIGGLLRQLILKEQTVWPSGPNAKPIMRPDLHPASEAFAREVLKSDDTELQAHW